MGETELESIQSSLPLLAFPIPIRDTAVPIDHPVLIVTETFRSYFLPNSFRLPVPILALPKQVAAA